MGATDHGKGNTLQKLRMRKDRGGPPGRSRDSGPAHSQTETSSGGSSLLTLVETHLDGGGVQIPGTQVLSLLSD